MNQILMQKYADFIVKTGVNVQKGQTFIIQCSVEAAFFARACAVAGFEAGAADVVVKYSDDQLTRIRMQMGEEASLCDVKPHLVRSYLDYAESEGGVCLLSIVGNDPEALKGLDAGKINRVNMARLGALKEWRSYTLNDRVQWCVAAIPTAGWATTVFPDLAADEAVETLWELIFKVCRIRMDTNPVSVWKQQTDKMTEHRDLLNRLKLRHLHIISGNGTDLIVGLADDHTWESARSKSEKGVPFLPNIPTEEVFTAPHRSNVNGVVKGTRPYVYNGQLIDGFSVTFENGRVVKYSAEKNEELLGQLLNSDEGASRIGEIALVPASSPINQSGVLFYNTLFDENAACHIAFGAGYPGTVVNGTQKTTEELLALGVNDSTIHEDVMIGAADTFITGTTQNGDTLVIFRDGEWAF